MYVAITRAENQLFTRHCLKRRRGKEWHSCERSRFIAEMGADHLQFGGEKRDTAGNRAQGSASPAALKSFLVKPQSTAG